MIIPVDTLSFFGRVTMYHPVNVSYQESKMDVENVLFSLKLLAFSLTAFSVAIGLLILSIQNLK